jgi:predicted PurR-regulated permease PerM
VTGIITVLREYKHPILIFVSGAILAYLLAPLVRGLQSRLRHRRPAILSSYLLLFAAHVSGYSLVPRIERHANQGP